MTIQEENLEKFLSWLKSCPYKYTISSMSGGFVHVKFLIPFESTPSVTDNWEWDANGSPIEKTESET